MVPPPMLEASSLGVASFLEDWLSLRRVILPESSPSTPSAFVLSSAGTAPTFDRSN